MKCMNYLDKTTTIHRISLDMSATWLTEMTLDQKLFGVVEYLKTGNTVHPWDWPDLVTTQFIFGTGLTL